MIDLTPLDVRKKRGDFTKALRGYDAAEVDTFIELVAERMEDLVKENLQLKERSERLGEQVDAQDGREQAVQEALVTAQTLRQEVKEQAKREAQLLEREARGRIEQIVQEADRLLDERRAALDDLERHRIRFLKAFRTLLERELDAVEVESNRAPLEDVTLDLELGRGSWTAVEDEAADDEESAEAGTGDDAEIADPVVAGEEDAETLEPGADDDEVAGDDDNSGSALEADGVGETDAVAEADAEESVESIDGAESTVEAETEEAEGVEAAADSGGEDSLWLSSILRRDQQEKD